MILPHPDMLNRFNKYALVMLAAKRARQLQEQGIARRALVKSSSTNPLTIALEEVAIGRLIPTFHPEPLSELMEPEASEAALTVEEFEEAMAKVTMDMEANRKPSDNGHETAEIEPEAAEAEEETDGDAELGEEEILSLSSSIEDVLDLDEDDLVEADGPPSDEDSEQQGLFEDEHKPAE
ncbi:MAG: DNA-directed RNA polymerase subunit omega [bacterium]|nr:DNA-directed RNA polymerase subunit omega [bacterium]